MSRVLAIAGGVLASLLSLALLEGSSLAAAETGTIALRELVTPSFRWDQQGQPVRFAIHGFLEFGSLAELFAYIDSQADRWKFGSPEERRQFADGLLARGIESRLCRWPMSDLSKF